MSVEWFTRSTNGLATIYETNITLNTVASNHFKNSFGALIGYDKNSSDLLIKSISKEEVTMGIYNEDEIHKISVKPSYGRISGKQIIHHLCQLFPLDFSNNAFHKFECEWSVEDKTLKVKLLKEVK